MAYGTETLADYELLEMLLFIAIPRRDTKPLAKRLIARFGSLHGVFQAQRQTLKEEKIPPRAIAILQIPALAAQAMRAVEARQSLFLGNGRNIRLYTLDFLKDKTEPRTWILYLDHKNMLLRNEILPEPNELLPDDFQSIAIRVLDLHAAAMVILYRNTHYTATTLAQKTRALRKALEPISVCLHDGIVINGDGFVSLQQTGLLP